MLRSGSGASATGLAAGAVAAGEARVTGPGAATGVCAVAFEDDDRPRCHIGFSELTSMASAASARPITTYLFRNRFMLRHILQRPELQTQACFGDGVRTCFETSTS